MSEEACIVWYNTDIARTSSKQHMEQWLMEATPF